MAPQRRRLNRPPRRWQLYCLLCRGEVYTSPDLVDMQLHVMNVHDLTQGELRQMVSQGVREGVIVWYLRTVPVMKAVEVAHNPRSNPWAELAVGHSRKCDCHAVVCDHAAYDCGRKARFRYFGTGTEETRKRNNYLCEPCLVEHIETLGP